MPPPIKSNLDFEQCISGAYEDASGRLRVDVSGATGNDLVINPDGSINVVTSGSGSASVNIHDSAGNNLTSTNNAGKLSLDVNVSNSSIPVSQSGSWTVSLTNTSIEIGTVDQGTPNTLANAWPVKPTDGTNFQSFTASNEAKVSITQPLPTGSNTIGSINNISGTISLPTGASTSANQTTANASLSSIDGKLNSLGQKTMAASVPVVIASDQSPVAVTGTITTSPNVNVHDGTGVSISSTGSSLNVDVTNTVPVSQSGSWTVTANAGTNLNTSALNLESTQSAFKTANHSDLTTINTTLGSPFQAGGSIANTTFASTQSGTWTVQPGNTANTTPWLMTINQGGNSATVTGANALKVDGSAVTQPISGSVSVSNFPATVAVTQSTSPWVVSGTVTANIGTTNGLALDSTVSGLQVTQGSTTSGQKGGLTLGAVTTAAPSYTTGQSSPLSLDTSGNLRITGTVTSTPSGVQHVIIDSGTSTVNQGTSPWVVSGTVTANAGTGNFTVVQPTGTNLHTVVDSGTITISNFPTTLDTNYGTVGANTLRSAAQVGNATGAADFNFGTVGAQTLRTASQIGNATGAALFGAGTTTAQVLRVVLPTDQTAIPVTQSGSWTVTANAGTNLNTSALALDTSVNGLLLTQGSTTSGEKGPLIQGAVSSASPSYTDGQTSPLSLTTAGKLRTDLSTIAGNTALTGNGVTGTGSLRVTIASDNTAFTVNAAQSGTWSVGSTLDKNFGTVGANTLRTAAQIGNATGAADFGAGTTDAQTLRVVLPTDQTAIPVSQSGAWSVTANAGTNLNTSLLQLDTTGAKLNNTQGSTTSGQTGPLIMGAVTTAAPSYTTAQTSPLSLTTTGALRVDNSANTQPVSGSVTTTHLDIAPATQNITVQDTASTTTAMANGQNFITGTPTANSAASFAIASVESVEVQVTGTWTGTLSSEISMDGGTTWFTRGVKQAGSAYIISTFTGNFAGGLNSSGMTNYRVRATAAMTGTATVKIVESLNASSITVSNPILLKDGTTQSITNTIKAASTAAVATDTALVVTMSPNTALPTGTNSIGTVTSKVTQTTFVTGAKSSISTSAVQITTTSTAVNEGVCVKADNSNTGIVYVGLSTVTNGTTDATDGFKIASGESITIEVDNPNKVYVIASAASQKVYWVGV